MSDISFLSDLIQAAVASSKTGYYSERNQLIAISYYGFGGNGGCPMEEVGKNNNLTRESVRQITARVSREISLDNGLAAEIKKVESFISEKLPSSAEAMESLLVLNGYLPEGYAIEGLFNAIQIFSRGETSLKLIKEKGLRFLVRDDQRSLPRHTLSLVVKAVSKNGAAEISEIASRLTDVPLAERDSLIRSVIRIRPEAQYLCEGGAWVYFSNIGRNRLLKRMKKIFSFVESASLDDIMQGVERSWNKNTKNDAVLLPRRVFVCLFENHPSYSIDSNGVVTCLENFRGADELKDFELAIAQCIKDSADGFCREKQLEDALVKNATDKYSFSMMLNYSPLIVRELRSEEEKIKTGDPSKYVRGKYLLVGKPKR